MFKLPQLADLDAGQRAERAASVSLEYVMQDTEESGHPPPALESPPRSRGRARNEGIDPLAKKACAGLAKRGCSSISNPPSLRTTRCALECGCTCTVLLDVAVLWPLRTLDLRLTARGRAKYPLFSHEVTPHRVRSCSTAGDKMIRKVRQPCQRSSASAIALFVDQRQNHLVLLSQTSENGNSRSTAPVWH